MFEEFLDFLKKRGVLNAGGNARLYHWTAAEVRQSRKVAEELDLAEPANLLWYDLQKSVLTVPIGLPGAYGYGLKPVAKAIGDVSPDYRIEWPEDLAERLSAMVMGFRLYMEEGRYGHTNTGYFRAILRSIARQCGKSCGGCAMRR